MDTNKGISLEKCGVVYIATGVRFARSAALSADSVRGTCGDLKTHLFCDADNLDLFTEHFDSVSVVEDPHRRSKLDYMCRSPFDFTLYLDADTRVVADIREMFQLLARFDLAVAHAPRRNHAHTRGIWNLVLPDSFPQLNSGVMIYRNGPDVRRFLETWRDAYKAAGLKKDQVTFRELLWSSTLRFAVLPPEYNVRYEKYLTGCWEEWEARPRILHMQKFVEREKRKTPPVLFRLGILRHRLQMIRFALLGVLVALRGRWV